jgi:hypothetical protein
MNVYYVLWNSYEITQMHSLGKIQNSLMLKVAMPLFILLFKRLKIWRICWWNNGVNGVISFIVHGSRVGLVQSDTCLISRGNPADTEPSCLCCRDVTVPVRFCSSCLAAFQASHSRKISSLLTALVSWRGLNLCINSFCWPTKFPHTEYADTAVCSNSAYILLLISHSWDCCWVILHLLNVSEQYLCLLL